MVPRVIWVQGFNKEIKVASVRVEASTKKKTEKKNTEWTPKFRVRKNGDLVKKREKKGSQI